MKALVIGGGIGGPAAAMALQRAGVDAVVYDAHAGPAESLGLFLTLGVNGMRVLRELGVLERLMAADTIATPWMELSSATGKRLGVVSNGWLDGRMPSITVMRGVLQRVLADEARARGIEIRYAKRFVGFDEAGSGVVARFKDGTEAAGDVLIGCDGIGSCVRTAIDAAAPAPSYTGLLNLGGVTRGSGLPPTPGTMHMVWGRRAFFGYTVRPDGEAWWFANIGRKDEPTGEELAAVSQGEWKRRLRELYAGDPLFIGELIERSEDVGATPIHDLPSLATWHRGHVVVMGDAAHAVSPSAGQGASMALEDALMLARCLRDVTPVESALARFEELRRPRTERIVATGRRRGAYKAPGSRAALFVRDLIMPLVFKLFATERSMSWIYDYEIPWDEPLAAPLRRPEPPRSVPAARAVEADREEEERRDDAA